MSILLPITERRDTRRSGVPAAIAGPRIAVGTPLVCCLRVNYVENKGTGVGGTDAASDRERYGL